MDLINRQAAIDALAEWDDAAINNRLNNLPPVDAVQVIRCKDCKWFNKLGCAIRIVDESDKPKETDFCSFAEQKGR